MIITYSLTRLFGYLSNELFTTQMIRQIINTLRVYLLKLKLIPRREIVYKLCGNKVLIL